MASEDLKRKAFDFKGRLTTSVDAATIGNNFSSLKNFRYTATSIKAIAGMSKINTTALSSYPKVRSGFHFRKSQPSESHLLVQAYNAGETASKIYDNTTAIPTAGDFNAAELYTDGSGAGRGRFSLAPFGAMAYCNGVAACVWGGDEFPVSRFINYDPSDTFRYDFTDMVTNTLTDSLNVAALNSTSGGINADTMLMLHADSALTDSSPTTPHTVSSNGTFSYDTTNKVFGAAAFNFGPGYLSIPDNADFDFSGGNFTIDGRFRITSLAAATPLYYHGTDANNYFNFFVDTDGSVKLSIYAAGAEVVALATSAGAVTASAFYHIELDESGNDWYIFVNGVVAAYVSDTDRAANYTGSAYIGYDGTNQFNGQVDEYRVSDVARHTAAFEVPTAAYTASTSSAYMYIGALFPLQGFKLYVSSANASASNISVEYWNGSIWTAVLTLIDGTSSGGASLAQTGSVTFTDTQSVAEVKVIDQVLLYWYRVSVDVVDGGTAISYITVDGAFQPVNDIWDGELRSEFSFQRYSSAAYQDNTINVYAEDYSSADTGSFAQLGSLTSGSDFLVVGFLEHLMGMELEFVGGAVNTTASTVMDVAYWNGTGWVSVTALDDGTVDGGTSFAKTGVISWASIPATSEFKKSIAKEASLFYYKISFNKNLSADVKLDYVGGIPAQKRVGGYRFPLFSGNRLLLCNNSEQDKHSVLVSARNTFNVFNGEDSVELFFGDNTELVAGTTLYSQFGSNLYNIAVLCKYDQTWILIGDGPETYEKYQASDTVGCVAPETMKTAHVGFELVPGQGRFVAIWEGSEGIYLFDGKNIRPIHADISDYFDRKKSYSINRDVIGTATSFVDEFNTEYHWLFASGTSTTLDKEFVFDIQKEKWFEIDRTTGKRLQLGISVTDTLGNKGVYGAIDTGYVERLENGNTFDGTAIAASVRFGDSPLENDAFIASTVRKFRLVAISKTVTASQITVSHYGDTSSTPTSWTISPLASGKRIIGSEKPSSVDLGPFLLHSFELSLSTSDEDVGFEPLAIGVAFRDIRVTM